MKMTIATKVGLGSALMMILLIANSLVGIRSSQNIGEVLDFITEHAWDAADGAMEGTIGVQAELLAVERLQTSALSGADAAKVMGDARQLSEEAFLRMKQSGLVPSENVSAFEDGFARFESTRDQLLEDHKAFSTSEKTLNDSFDRFVQFMSQVEAIGDGAVDELNNRMSDYFSWSGEVRPRWEIADNAMELRIALLERRYFYQQLVSGLGSKESQSRLDELLGEMKQKVEALSQHALFGESVAEGQFAEMTYIEVLRSLLADHEKNFADAIHKSANLIAARSAYNQATDQLLALVEEIEESGDAAVEGKADEVLKVKSEANWTILATLTIGLIVAIAITIYSNRAIVNPIRRVANKLEEIGSQGGDLTVQLPVKGNDELALLAKGFNQFVVKIHGIVNEVRMATEQMATAANQLTSISKNVTEEVTQQQNETDQVARAISEMSSAVQEVARSATKTAQATADADKDAEAGKRVVAETIEAIRRTAKQVDRSTEVINQLSLTSENIGSVVEVIRSIAEQTNLLALNAAIEAARAGEQGRGFAVVADEVRNLANRTQESTEEIQRTVEQLQQGASSASKEMEQGRVEADMSVEQTMKAGASLDNINNGIATITDMSAQIASAVEEQSAVAHEINRSVSEIRTISDNTANGVKQINDATQSLNRLSGHLSHLVGQFRV